MLSKFSYLKLWARLLRSSGYSTRNWLVFVELTKGFEGWDRIRDVNNKQNQVLEPLQGI